jgi:hypothetical protein
MLFCDDATWAAIGGDEATAAIRYDLVLHLVSTAVDLPDVFDNARRWRQNLARCHTRRQSAALCPRFAGLYADAPATATLGNTCCGMDDKLRRVLELVAHHAPPAMASLQAAIPRSLGELRPGAPLIVVDVEVHDWPHMQFQPTWLTGQFGHRTGTRDYELSYMRIVQIAWCVRREDGECEHRNFYVSGTDRPPHLAEGQRIPPHYERAYYLRGHPDRSRAATLRRRLPLAAKRRRVAGRAPAGVRCRNHIQGTGSPSFLAFV